MNFNGGYGSPRMSPMLSARMSPFHQPPEGNNPNVNPGNVGLVAQGNPFPGINPGGVMQPYPSNPAPQPAQTQGQGNGGFDPKALLQALLQLHGQQFQQPSPGNTSAGGQVDPRFLLQNQLQQTHSFNPTLGQLGNAWDSHHEMVNAASSLARFLAQQHTAGLRRYNGRT